MRKGCVLLLFLPFLLCALTSCNSKQGAQVISDLAYSTRSQNECEVYLQEDGVFTPFIVVTGDYNGNVLLVREDVLPLPRRINEYSSFYENSEIDQYLNQEYLHSIAEKEQILTSQIDITEDNAIGFSGNEIKTIERKVFLLSLTELGCDDSYNAAVEGKPIIYFETPKNRIAFNNEHATSWWLRSPNTYYLSCTYGVGPEGTIGSGNSYDNNGIRPAFCLPASTAIYASKSTEGIIMYNLSMES